MWPFVIGSNVPGYTATRARCEVTMASEPSEKTRT